MEINFSEEKEDLAKAKHDLLMRFIKDQEHLQTRQVGLKPSSDDATFDILDGLAVSKDNSNSLCMKGDRTLANNTIYKVNEHRRADLDSTGISGMQYMPRTQTCIPNFRARKEDTFRNIDLKEKQHRGRNDRLKSGKKLPQNPPERPATEGSVRRLRSAPSFSGRHSRSILRAGDINVELKTRKVSSLSIVVPKEGETDTSLLTRSRRPPLSCTQLTRPAGSRATVGISAVDVELFDRRTVSSLTAPYTMFHLPPIASETAHTPPST